MSHPMNREDGNFPYYIWGKPGRKICPNCRFIAQYVSKCGCCGTEMIEMDGWKRARPPRKNASKRKWKKFAKLFKLNIKI